MDLDDGFHAVPPGKIASVETALDMRRPAPLRPESPDGDTVRRVPEPDLDWYRALFRRVGADWLWFSRLRLSDGELRAILTHRDVEVYALSANDTDEGLLELDFRVPAACEIAFLGVTANRVGGGSGRRLMNFAIARAWSRPITRLWLHTCTLDHPAALGFYIRSGFTPYQRTVEIVDDPRLTGLLPESAAPHVPILRP